MCTASLTTGIKEGGSEDWNLLSDDGTSVGMSVMSFMDMGPMLKALVHKYSEIVWF